MERTMVAPGITCTSIPGDKFKKCKISVNFILPSERETATAMALLPHVLERRCKEVPDATELSRKLFGLYGAELGSDCYVMGASRIFTMGISGLKSIYSLQNEDLEKEYSELLCNLLFDPILENEGFSAADVAIEKEKQAEFLRSEMNDKRSYCIRQARRKVFGNSPLGIESGGYLDEVEGLTPQQLYKAYLEMLRTAEIHVITIGTDATLTGKKVAACLAGVQRDIVKATVAGAVEKQEQYQRFTEPMDSVQGKLCIVCTAGVVADTRRDMAMRVASALLGGLPTSRLFLNVREKQSLCYYCASIYNGYTGTLFIDSGIDHSDAEKAARAILHELKEMQQSEVTDEEMEFALLALESSYAAAYDNAEALGTWVLAETLKGSNRTLDEAAKTLRELTKEDIRQALASFVPSVEYVITQKEERS